MDEDMQKLEQMDEDDFEALREKRKLQMQKASAQRQKNLLNGHGRYMELSDQKEFFDASKNSKMVRPSPSNPPLSLFFHATYEVPTLHSACYSTPLQYPTPSEPLSPPPRAPRWWCTFSEARRGGVRSSTGTWANSPPNTSRPG